MPDCDEALTGDDMSERDEVVAPVVLRTGCRTYLQAEARKIANAPNEFSRKAATAEDHSACFGGCLVRSPFRGCICFVVFVLWWSRIGLSPDAIRGFTPALLHLDVTIFQTSLQLFDAVLSNSCVSNAQRF